MAEFGESRQIGFPSFGGVGDHFVARAFAFDHRDPLRDPDQGMEPEESANDRLDASDQIVKPRDVRAFVRDKRFQFFVR